MHHTSKGAAQKNDVSEIAAEKSHNATIMDPPVKAMVMERLQVIGEDTLRERNKGIQVRKMR